MHLDVIHILSTKVNAYQLFDQDSEIHANDEWRQKTCIPWMLIPGSGILEEVFPYFSPPVGEFPTGGFLAAMKFAQ